MIKTLYVIFGLLLLVIANLVRRAGWFKSFFCYTGWHAPSEEWLYIWNCPDNELGAEFKCNWCGKIGKCNDSGFLETM